MLTLQAVEPDVLSAVKKLQLDASRKLELLADMIGADVIAYLRSLTSELRPPAPGKHDPRQAHPGHWADVKGQLAGAYGYEVERRSDAEVALILKNGSEHALWLEIKEGFFVLRGVAERNGPVAQALRKVIAAVAPGWQVEG